MKKNKIEKVFHPLEEKEINSIEGGYINLILRVGAALFGGYQVGYGWGSYNCECLKEPDLSKAGPTHYRA
ncbi:hypothetical protein [Mongoliitalea lutea]|jgi:hypothetical protein|uniref:Uncharacterized protein n=1 Tax=Mongoliitalea lutea TaxID=849756 RepID=A0A8J3CWQ5_9BACT|nr:hypothetical protein [Mongoliitalea lutea]GHB37491.1 hypothetical protein GCM10008106_18390 [Mongoliitalea lutea]